MSTASNTVRRAYPVNDDFFVVLPRLGLKHVAPAYAESVSLARMRCNPEFDLQRIAK